MKIGNSMSVRQARALADEAIVTLVEGVDHATHADIVTAASKLLSAISAFKEKAGPVAMHAVAGTLQTLEKTLEDMSTSPGAYVSNVKPRQHVTLKATKKAETI